MQINHLHAFLAVADELNYRRAATRLYISQPALSAQVCQLERHLGVRLFERDRTGTRLTTEGRDLLPVARDAIAAFAQVELAAQRGPRSRTRFVCGVLAMGVGDLTWQLLRSFHSARPDVDLTVTQLGFTDAIPALESGLCDVLLSVGPFGTTRVHAETVGTMPVDAVLPRNHPLSCAEAVPLAWLARHLRIRPPDSMTPDWIDFWAMKDLGAHPGLALDPGNSISQLIESISERGLVGMWPRGAGAPPQVTVRPLDQGINVPLQIVTRREEAPSVQQFLELGRRLAAST